MLHTVTVRTLAFAACGWLLACEASALTLGRARGAALIGRPLELVIPVTLDPSDTDGPCAGADLFYGEERVRAPMVRWEPGIGTQGVLRVTSTTPVDEPMVTLYLRAGCSQSATRRFVLLSEPPPEVEAPGAAPFAVQAPVVPAPGAARRGPSGSRQRNAAAAVDRTPRPRAEAAGVQRERPPARRLASAPPAERRLRAAGESRAPAALRARLKLEPLDLTIERDPALRLSAELTTRPASDPRERDAAAALWQMLQKSPEQALQEGQRLQALERELGSLRDASRQDAAALRELRGHVERAQDGQRTASLLVLALATVLAALLAWLALRWQRVRQLERVGHWFEVHGEAALRNEAPTVPGPPAPAAGVGAAREHATAAPVAARKGAASAGPHGKGLQAGGGQRPVGIAELVDIHDKAGFFRSIGEPEQAVSLLESHVHEQAQTGVLAWLELLELYHSLGRRAEYERVRGEFRQRFAAQLPDFEHFDEQGAPLESYSRALARIVALWPGPGVLGVIEEAICRKPGDPGAEPFSLAAYRELVLLYHVATEMAAPRQEAPRDTGDTAPGFPGTSLQPLHALADPPLSERERLMIPPPSRRLGVDIELEEAPGVDTGPSALDFDVSAYDDATDSTAAEPPRKRG